MSLWPAGFPALDVRTVSLIGTTTGGLLDARGGWLLGWTVTNHSAADAAQVELIDGGSDAGSWIESVELAALTTYSHDPGTPGIPCPSGLFLRVDNGTVDAFAILADVITVRT